MHFLTGVALATLATSAVAKQISSPQWDKYVDERGFAGHEDPHEFGHGGLHAREADAEAIESWEGAHGGKASAYKPYGEHDCFGHHAARSEPNFHGERLGHGVEGQHFGAHHARSVPEFEDEDIDTSLEGYLVTRSTPEHFGHPFEGQHPARSAPEHYGHPLEGQYYGGHHARSAPEHFGHPFEGQHYGGHHARSIPDFDEKDVDTSLEGYLETRSPPKGHRPGDKYYEEYHQSAKHQQESWVKPMHVARALKDIYDHYSGKAPQGAQHGGAGSHHFARDAFVPSHHDPKIPADEFGHGRHHAREAFVPSHHDPKIPADQFEHGRHHAREAYMPSKHDHKISAGEFEHEHHFALDAARMSYEHAPAHDFEHGHHCAREASRMEFEHALEPFHRPHHARDAEPEPVRDWYEQSKQKEDDENNLFSRLSHTIKSAFTTATHPAHQASGRMHVRDAATANQAAHPTESHVRPEEDEHPTWTKHTAEKTAVPSKTGGWGVPW